MSTFSFKHRPRIPWRGRSVGSSERRRGPGKTPTGARGASGSGGTGPASWTTTTTLLRFSGTLTETTCAPASATTRRPIRGRAVPCTPSARRIRRSRSTRATRRSADTRSSVNATTASCSPRPRIRAPMYGTRAGPRSGPSARRPSLRAPAGRVTLRVKSAAGHAKSMTWSLFGTRYRF
jgi:hypothetical protein